MRAAGLIGAIAALVTGQSAFADDVRFGDFVFGAPTAALLATGAWEDVTARHSVRRGVEIANPAGVRIDGRIYAATITERDDGAYFIALRRETDAAHAAACESEGAALVSLLAAQLGRFEGPAPMPAIHLPAPAEARAARAKSGSVAITPEPRASRTLGVDQELVMLADGSAVTVGAADRDGDRVPRRHYGTDRVRVFTLASERSTAGLDIRIEARYERDAAARCEVSLRADRL